MKKIIPLILLLILTAFEGISQQDFIMYNMHEIPQSSYSNPSNQFNGKFYIGIPGISSNFISFTNSKFSFSDIVLKEGDSLRLDVGNLIDEAGNDNYLSFNSRIDLLSFGFHISPKTQISFNATENASVRLNYTDDLIQVIWNGNGSFDDNTVNFEGMGINVMHYREYGLGVSHQLNDKLRLGVKAKYLYGMENIFSEKTDISLFTDPETFELTARADISLKTAGISDVDDDESTMDYLTGRDNKGFALDLGANYQVNEQLSVNASILDLGSIEWNDYTKNYSNPGSSFFYDGITLNAFTGDDNFIDEDATSFDVVIDSLEDALNLDTTRGSYKTSLTGRFFIGANYQLDERTLVGGLIQSEVFQERFIPSITASIHRKLIKWVGVSASYTIINQSYANIGLGVNLNPGPVQFYLVSDNVLGAFKPQDSRYFQVRFGINLLFGGQKSKQFNPSYEKVLKEKKEKKEKKKKEKEENKDS